MFVVPLDLLLEALDMLYVLLPNALLHKDFFVFFVFFAVFNEL